MCMERWDDTDRGTKYSEKNLSRCQSLHQKSHMDWRGIEGRSPRLEAGDLAPEPWHGFLEVCLSALYMKINFLTQHTMSRLYRLFGERYIGK